MAAELERSQNHFTVSAKEVFSKAVSVVQRRFQTTADVVGAFSNLYNQLLDIDFHEGILELHEANPLKFGFQAKSPSA